MNRNRFRQQLPLAVLIVAQWALLSAIEQTARATPPPAGLTRNSLSVRSTTGRYRPQKPTISPYLALSPGTLGNIAAINYFTVVRPELNQRQVNQQQAVDLRTIERQVRAIEAEEAQPPPGSPPTIGYMTQQKYFGAPLNQSTTQPGLPTATQPRILSTPLPTQRVGAGRTAR